MLHLSTSNFTHKCVAPRIETDWLLPWPCWGVFLKKHPDTVSVLAKCHYRTPVSWIKCDDTSSTNSDEGTVERGYANKSGTLVRDEFKDFAPGRDTKTSKIPRSHSYTFRRKSTSFSASFGRKWVRHLTSKMHQSSHTCVIMNTDTLPERIMKTEQRQKATILCCVKFTNICDNSLYSPLDYSYPRRTP